MPDSVDPVTLEVVRNACSAVCEEMNATLVRTGYSPNIKERRDCSCALFDPSGALLAQAETMPVHLGAMPFSVAAVLDRHPIETLESGDVLAVNDPYHGGAHLPDLTLVTPIVESGAVVALAANRAHHADIGGARAGSVAADSTEIYQEGLRIPPVKLRAGGDPNEAVQALIRANVRTPTERSGDLRAQIAANETGRRRFLEVLERHGRSSLTETLTALLDYAERRMRTELSELPNGTASFTDWLDDDGRGTTDIPIEATVTVEGSSITVDFTGSADQTDGPVNAVRAVTASATYYVVRAITDSSIPANAGCYRPITIVTDPGTIVDARPPAAVVAGNLETSQRVTDVVLGAVASIDPDRSVAAGQGTMNNVTVGGFDGRDGQSTPFTFYETQAGGFGARPTLDGMDAVHVHMSNTRNTPVEVLETAYPMRVWEYALRPDSGGSGTHRGGVGIRRDIEIRSDGATVSIVADRQRRGPYGLEGGEEGAPGRAILHSSPTAARQGEGDPLPAKGVFEADPGSVISIRTPGGGGFGDPAERDRAAIRADLRAGLISAEAALDRYDLASADLDSDRQS